MASPLSAVSLFPVGNDDRPYDLPLAVRAPEGGALGPVRLSHRGGTVGSTPSDQLRKVLTTAVVSRNLATSVVRQLRLRHFISRRAN